jgi:hypothetical protein
MTGPRILAAVAVLEVGTGFAADGQMRHGLMGKYGILRMGKGQRRGSRVWTGFDADGTKMKHY